VAAFAVRFRLYWRMENNSQNESPPKNRRHK
jgi:hypothetical protein